MGAARHRRTKAGREVDFVLARSGDRVDALECKWAPAGFDTASLRAFRSHYPKGRNYLVTPQDGPPYAMRFGDLEVTVCNPQGLGPDARPTT